MHNIYRYIDTLFMPYPRNLSSYRGSHAREAMMYRYR